MFEHACTAVQWRATYCPIARLFTIFQPLSGLKVWDLPFIAHFGEVSGWVPYIGVGGFDVLTTMYRSRSGTKSELAGEVNQRETKASLFWTPKRTRRKTPLTLLPTGAQERSQAF